MTTALDLATHLQTTAGLHPKQEWLTSYLRTVRPNIPRAAVQKTALFRLLASDIQDTLIPQSAPPNTLPSGIDSPAIKELVLRGTTIPVQILDIEDIGQSRWSQVETLEQFERGETTKGREIIRLATPTVPTSTSDAGGDEDGNGNTGANLTMTTARSAESVASKGPHKLLLQDCKGTKVFAFEMAPVQGIDLGTSIGCKLLLKDALVARGVVMLDPATVTVCGGKVEAWDKAWRMARKESLKTKARAGMADNDDG